MPGISFWNPGNNEYICSKKKHFNMKLYTYLLTTFLSCIVPFITCNGQQSWTGTGFALNNGYIVTNHHVVDGATSISVYGIRGEINKSYKATVIASDSKADLAIIKINDSSFHGFGDIPYSIKTKTANVGEHVYVLGYPMVQAMGTEVKLTDGIISSRSGYQGDYSTYQISAPLQPGNSGGPMFDNDGQIIGITNAGINQADNVGYAIKTSYLYNLLDNIDLTSVLPTNNILKGKTLPQQVTFSKGFVFLISCLGSGSKTEEPTNDVSSKYATIDRQAEVSFNIRHWWNKNGGSSKRVHGKTMVGYSGFNKIAVIYYSFENDPTVFEYRLKVLAEQSGWGKENRFYIRQYIVQDIDDPSSKCLMIVSNTEEPNSREVLLFTDPVFYDVSKYLLPPTGEIIFHCK